MFELTLLFFYKIVTPYIMTIYPLISFGFLRPCYYLSECFHDLAVEICHLLSPGLSVLPVALYLSSIFLSLSIIEDHIKLPQKSSGFKKKTQIFKKAILSHFLRARIPGIVQLDARASTSLLRFSVELTAAVVALSEISCRKNTFPSYLHSC